MVEERNVDAKYEWEQEMENEDSVTISKYVECEVSCALLVFVLPHGLIGWCSVATGMTGEVNCFIGHSSDEWGLKEGRF